MVIILIFARASMGVRLRAASSAVKPSSDGAKTVPANAGSASCVAKPETCVMHAGFEFRLATVSLVQAHANY